MTELEVGDWVRTLDDKMLFEIVHVGEDYVFAANWSVFYFNQIEEIHHPFHFNNLIKK